ncbi:hypothetical protein PWY87_11780 [Kribbella solani]|uniref:hypothetical protein n=1 Tax=Kribbella solani TaxID=236067 RepID=UPI0029BED51C|nr:hypothetical protein [Kribbella solani]MDX3002355.1 hypothetical protein [Kribbella solani]
MRISGRLPPSYAEVDERLGDAQLGDHERDTEREREYEQVPRRQLWSHQEEHQ